MVPISYNVRSLLVRRATTFATAFGIGLVVFVLASALMLGSGITKTMVGAGRDDNAVVLRKGADNEMSSSLEVKTINLIAAAPGVKRGTGGATLASGEVVVVIAQDKLGATFDWTSDSAMSAARSVLRNVGSLSKHLSELAPA